MPEIKAVVFDIDGTLTEKNSWQQLMLAMGGTWAEDLEVVELERSGKITHEEANARILALWKRYGKDTRENFTNAMEAMALRPDAVSLIEYLKTKGIVICLITGSTDLNAQIVARKVGVENFYYNTKLNWDDHGRILDFKYEWKQGELKLKQFHEFLKKNNLQPEQCAVIGDSDNDHELFKITGKGIAVRTEFEDKILETLAWQVVNTLAEIRAII
ncbi:MAG: hypothetical protein A3J07_00715 [Candidatus Doudnabacteria bacterium RIFCSPLOWO2_02_FULL_49_13]|uniref:phosphoserine phosphatase n=1 Tax=Candidatus Doudnabacteria bacterium RIFCSPHIGHO2_12_FULL_48_16 TaxID=1817838 RepID=A0A1F5PJZ4_9BACT|nr:MAG: hypothetical protein A3B77_03630 [Candidatus Doudnabacteria bacterium RIFCSPHIGHO2_02_FULL_49_24]OGE88527.1 MAG: hypothetical protein A2760_00365 [Candidatus Doudnabacteria bacterium RIFCSPHIGHO2_01_FULL_50_67]OGE90275.1 MAG: hypothetical protein A3E29_04225 [Candidatus Doudnabacteria bacterium RIFCSPHIGHO2_12_FULL_48_16]OGE96931.1 MAG: hypothetical protein A2990_04015 [Candidatus Doudnabacteria bacterium RIFCSPLOWO2_01_FULL_49_40]OGF02331.1 MAG: hypothetical protein A3J07_00715 [Candid